MRSSVSDLNLFRVFVTIYNTRNLTRAGEQLGVTQPAISNALARLRTLYDDPLFIRRGKTMRPTYKTEKVIPDIDRALRLLYDTLEPADADV